VDVNKSHDDDNNGGRPGGKRSAIDKSKADDIAYSILNYE
jgi:hypothetical protein